jgi:transcriptional regulator with XRE-family HTH domain
MPNQHARIKPINTDWFVAAVERRRISQAEFARRMDLDPSAVSRMFHGERKMTLNEVASIAKILGETVEEVLFHAGLGVDEIAKDASVEISGWVDEHFRVHFEKVSDPKRAPAIGGRGVKALRFQTPGTGMEPLDGGLIYFKRVRGVSVDAIGRFCVLKVMIDHKDTDKGSETIVGVLKRDYAKGPHIFRVLGLDGHIKRDLVRVLDASIISYLKL